MNKYTMISTICITLCFIMFCTIAYSGIVKFQPVESNSMKTVTQLEYNESDEQLEYDEIELVDNKINEYLSSNEYKNSSKQEREKMTSKVLKELANDNLIKNLTYDNKNSLFSFQYIDGSLGGIQLQDINESSSELAMN